MCDTVPECAICQDVLGDGNVRPVTALACAHPYHTDCLQTLCETTGCPLVELRCPTCKKTTFDFVEQVPEDDVASDGLGPASAATAAAPTATAPTATAPTATASTAPAPTATASDALTTEASAPTTRAPDTAAPTSEASPCEAESGFSPGGVAVHHPKLSAPSVFCQTCGLDVEYLNCRILSKGQQTWRCNKCRSKITTLYRAFGSWPVHGFEAIPLDAQQSFFRETGLKDLSNAVCNPLEKYDTNEDVWEEGGAFLPLSVWTAKGFDCIAIETKTPPSDRRPHPILGETYRVKIMTTLSRGIRGNQAEPVLVRPGQAEGQGYGRQARCECSQGRV